MSPGKDAEKETWGKNRSERRKQPAEREFFRRPKFPARKKSRTSRWEGRGGGGGKREKALERERSGLKKETSTLNLNDTYYSGKDTQN